MVDVLCTAGPRDRAYEETQPTTSVSLVLAGTFTYRGPRGTSLLSAGSTLLVNAGHSFECSHRYGEGDRCLSFQFEPEMLESVARDAGMRTAGFTQDRLPPLRTLALLAARAEYALGDPGALEEMAFELAAEALRAAAELPRSGASALPPQADRIAPVLRSMAARSDVSRSLDELSAEAGMSRYHFLRSFRAVTGVTPHQWILRARLREAARRLASSRDAVTEIALDVGFSDLSNFIRTFRAEFGTSPREFRRRSVAGSVAAR